MLSLTQCQHTVNLGNRFVFKGAIERTAIFIMPSLGLWYLKEFENENALLF